MSSSLRRIIVSKTARRLLINVENEAKRCNSSVVIKGAGSERRERSRREGHGWGAGAGAAVGLGLGAAVTGGAVLGEEDRKARFGFKVNRFFMMIPGILTVLVITILIVRC